MGLFRDRCSFCGAAVKRGALFCPACGAEMFKCPYCKGDIAENTQVCPQCSAEFTKPRFLGGKCPTCGKEVSKFRRYCPHCGADAETLLRKCGACGALAKPGSRFCSGCGTPFDRRSAAVVEQVRWRRSPGEFARRYDIENIRGLLRAGITVDHGTRALLLQDGSPARTLDPGYYGIDTQLEEIDLDHSMSVVAADTSDSELVFDIGETFARDGVPLAARMSLVLRLEDPSRFLANVMKEQDHVSAAQVRDYLAPEVKNATDEALRQHDGVTLTADAAVKASISSFLFNHLRSTLDRLGLQLMQVRALSLKQPELDAQRKAEGKTALMEHLRDVSRKRIDVWDELRKLAASKKMLEITHEEELAKFVQEVDRDRLIRDEEIYELRTAFAEKREDRELARKHLAEKLEIEHRVEQKRLELLGEAGIEEGVMDIRLRTEKARLEADLHAKRERELADLQIELKRKVDHAEADLDIHAAKVKLGFYARQQKIEMDHKEASLRQQRELEFEGKRLEMFSKASAEALIAMAGPEQARILADLRQTEQMKDLSEEKITALVAGKSPAVAAALAEKYKAAAQGIMDAETRALYDKLMAAQKETYEKGMEMMKDVAAAAAGHHVIYPPPGGMAFAGGQPAYAAPPPARTACPKCNRLLSAGAAFCDTCGHQLAS